MKDTFTQKVTAISSCLADYAIGSIEEDNNKLVSHDRRRVRRSAAMIGFAISMSATGMVLSQDKAAIAANSVTANTSLPTLPSLPKLDKASNETASDRDENQLAPLAVKHQVQLGESIQKLAQTYKIDPAAIATTNNLSLSADLKPGKTIKIPSVKEVGSGVKEKEARAQVSQTQVIASKSLNTSLDHLRATRKRLQDSLAELKTEQFKTHGKNETIVADVSDVSQPLTLTEEKPELMGASNQTEIAQSAEPIEIPVLSFDSEKTSAVSKLPIDLPEVKTRTANPPSPQSSDNEVGVDVSRKEDPAPTSPSLASLPSVPSAKEQTTAKADPNQPVPISVILPEAEATEEKPEIRLNSSQQTSFIPPTAIPKPQYVTTTENYQVRPGDTINSIARRHGISTAELIRANGITNPNLIKVNQTLVIPQQSGVADKKRGTLAASANGLRSSNRGVPKGFITPNNSEPLDLEISTVQRSHTDKLKSDIASLQRSYGKQPEATPITIEPEKSNNDDKTVVGETLNSEWSSDRQAQQSPQEAIEERLKEQNPQLISAAPSNPGIYNDAFQIPVGTNVGPDLPGLSNPDDYLPNAPMRFNGYIWPSKGVLTSGFGRRWGRMHKGIDIAAPVGTPIMASAPGEVITAGWNSGGYGNLVKVRHPDGSVTLYAHNSRLLVRRGQKVEQGQQIAEMGSTGYSTGPHLHFEIHPSGSGARNPMAFLPKKRS